LSINPSLAWADNHRYSIISRAQDITTSNGLPNTPNYQVNYSTVVITIDQTRPTTAITVPTDNAAFSNVQPMTNIAGTANDANTFASGIQRVQLSIAEFNGGTTHYFDGFNFGTATTEYMLLATGGNSWSYWTPTIGNNLVDGATYRIHA